MYPGANLHPGANSLHLVRGCKFCGANKHPGTNLLLGANCAYERMYLSLWFIHDHGTGSRGAFNDGLVTHTDRLVESCYYLTFRLL